MTADEALLLLDSLLQGQKLKDIQELVFRHTWQGWTYPKIAKHAGYDTSYIRDVGYELWQQLSRSLGEQVTKKNVQSVVRRLEQQPTTEIRRGVDPLLTDLLSTEEVSPTEEVQDTSLKLIQSHSSIAQMTSVIETSTKALRSPTTRRYWGESIDVSMFYGRTQELSRLSQWIVDDHARLITLLGMGGMGKTTLATKVVETLQDQFDIIFWQSFRNAPPVDEVVSHLLQVLSCQQMPNQRSHLQISDPQSTDLPSSTAESAVEWEAESDAIAIQIQQIIKHLCTTRCLLVFDNLESILSSSTADDLSLTGGQFRSGYEDYGELCQRIGAERHISCLLVTSREKLQLLAPLEGDALPVRSLEVKGLGVPEVRSLMVNNDGYAASEADWQQLTDWYSGNPLALKIVSTTVRDVFDGNVPEFLRQGAIAFGDINTLLNEQLQRLSPIEKQVMYWLAINRESISLVDLRDDVVARIFQTELLEALLSLRRRSLVEKSAGLFTLQPVVMEYVTHDLITRVCQELETLELDLFLSHALIKAQAKDYVRDSQTRFVLAPIASYLINTFRSLKRVEEQLDRLRFQLQSSHFNSPGYGSGNLLNLLLHLNINLSGYDFSHLEIWQAHLQGAELHRVNFAHAHLKNCTFTQTFGSIISVAFSPNGELLATAGVNAEVCLWQVATGQLLRVCKGHINWVLSVAFHPHGHLLASAGEDHTTRLWDVATGTCLHILREHTDYVHSITFSPVGIEALSDKPVLATGSLDQTVKLWDVHTGECLQTLQGHTSWVETVAFNPDGHLFASGSGDRTIKLWNVTTGQCLRTLHGHEEEVTSIAFNADGTMLASGSNDRTVKVWEMPSGRCLNTLHGHDGRLWAVAFHVRGHFASASHDQTIKLWDISTGQCLTTLQGHRSQIRAIAFHPQKPILASGSVDQTIRLWQVDAAECIKVLQGYSSQIWMIAFHPNGIILASGSHDQMVRLWNTQTGECLNTLKGHSNWIRAVAFNPKGDLLASGSGDQTVKLWNVNTGHCLRTLRGHSSWIRAVAFSPDGGWLASTSHDQTVRLWNLTTGATDRILMTHTVWTRAIAFSPDGSLLVTCLDDSKMALWQVATGEQLRTFEGHTSQIWSTAFSPDGQILATGSSDQTIKLWNVTTGACIKTLTDHHCNVWCVAFSPDGTMLVSSGDDRDIRLWQLPTGQSRILSGHDRPVQWVVCSSDGKTLASGSEDETIRIWHLETGECLRVFRADRPYEGINITNITGLSDTQKTALRALGAYTETDF